MTDDLLERMRSENQCWSVSEAADRIAQLTAERDSLLAGHRTLNIDGARLETRIEKLIAEREMAANWWKEAVELTRQARLQYGDEKARAEKAEAECARLRSAKDQAYLERNHLVALLASLFPSGLKQTDIPGWDAEWHGAVYIDFPWGQASWHYHDSQAHLFKHLPPYLGEWDGHTTDQKYAAILAALKGETP